MDPQQFQLFLDQLTKISSRLDSIYSTMPEPDDKKGKDKDKIDRLQPREKERIKEIAKIYSKEFDKNFTKLTKKQEELNDKNEKIFQKNGIKVKLESVSRDVLRSLKKIFSESTARSLSMQTAPGGGKGGGGIAGAAGNFLGNLIGGAGPWGAIIAAIAAVGGVAVIYLLLQNLDKLSAFLKDALPAIGDFLVKILPPAIESAGKAMSTILLPLIQTVTESIVKLADTIMAHIPGILKSLGDILIPILTNVKEFFEFIISNIPSIVDSFFGGISKLTEVILSNLPSIMPYITAIAGYIKEIGLSLIDKIPKMLDTLKAVFLPTLSAVKDIILALIPPVKELLANTIEGIQTIAPYIKTILVSAFDNLRKIINTLVISLEPFVTLIGHSLLEAVKLVSTVVDDVTNSFTTFVNFIRDVAIKALDTVEKIFTKFSDTFKWLITQDPLHITAVATAVLALGAAVATFGLANASGNLIAEAGSFFKKGKTPIDSILALADKSDKLKLASDNIGVLSNTLAAFTQQTYGDGFVDQMDKVSKGIEKITGVKNLDKLENLKYVNELKNIDLPAKSVEIAAQQKTDVSFKESSDVFEDLYSSTTTLNDSITELTASLDNIKNRIEDSIKVQQQQAKLTDNSLGTLKEIRDKEQSSSNVVVNNSSSQMVLTQKQSSNFDFRRGLVAVNY
jgi:hypothetical protein